MEACVTEIPEYLLGAPLHHMNLIELLRRGLGHVVHAEADGVLLRWGVDGHYMISAAAPEVSRRLLGMIDEMDEFCVHQHFIIEQLMELYERVEYNECYQAVYMREAPPPMPEICEFRPLTPDMAEWVNRNYHNEPEDLEYIRWLIESGELTGAYIEGKCAGFVGRHAEGSLGLQHVLPEYRRSGLGLSLAQYAIRRDMELGNIPFAHVFVDNEASMALQRKLGTTVADGRVYWVEGFGRK